LSGIYRPDPIIGADYRSPADFRDAYRVRLAEMEALGSNRPTWLMFGNSFVQAPGMLADTLAAALPDRRIYFLQRNEPLFLRVAQLRILLSEGLRPERVFFALLPLDIAGLAFEPVSRVGVNGRGAVIHKPRLPRPPFDALFLQSRLALLGWVRSGQARPDPSFSAGDVTKHVTPSITDSLQRLLGELARLSRQNAVPVTLILIPDREQIFGKSGYAAQDKVIARAQGLDVFDARQIFAAAADKSALFLPDWHFTPRGNHLLLAGLLAHCAKIPKLQGAEGAR
jgi:hypothetical protein